MAANSRSLDKRVMVMRQSSTRDAAGQPVLPWVEVGYEWANIRHVSGVAAIKAGAESTSVRASVRVRTNTQATPGRRLNHRGVIYEVDATRPDNDTKDFVFLDCRQVL